MNMPSNDKSVSSGPDQPTTIDSDPAFSGDGPDFVAGQRLGPYRIERRLGAGGMGTVYLAEQLEPIQRRVALKLIRGHVQAGLAEAYFMVERQALARMDHPAIAKVFDAGTTADGYPYFAMEWVDGPTLSDHVAEQAPSLRDALALFVQICRGAHHAHQKGVIHRDLKPSNVLVSRIDGQARPKIIDFGIAIGVTPQDGAAPSFAQSAGTHRYMSPEQIQGQSREIDIRTDVFALGVVLYELVAPPDLVEATTSAGIDSATLHGALRASVGIGDAQAPATAISRGLEVIPAELRWILLSALQPERMQRYDSAEALGNDVERYLDGYPLRAVPSTSGYRLRKFVTRNRTMVAAGALVAVALVIGAGAATYGMLQARDAAARATLEADKAGETSRFLGDLLSGVSPEVARDLDKTLLHKILDGAGERAQKELAAHPQVLAEIEGTIGRTYNSLAEPKRAIEHSTRAYELSKQELGENALATLRLQRDVGLEMANAGQLRKGCELTGRNRTALERAMGANNKFTLEAGVDLASCDQEMGDFAAADARLVKLLPLIAASEGPTSRLMLDAMATRGSVLSYTGHFEEAESVLKDTVARKTQKYGAQDPQTLESLNNLAIVYLQSHRFKDAEAVLRPMLPICENIYGPEHGFTLNIVNNLAGALRQQATPEKIAESGPYYKRTLDGDRKKYGERHQNTAQALHNYGNYLLDVGDVDGAIAAQQQALALAKELFGPKHQVTAELEYGLGKALVRGKRYAEAEPVLLDAVTQERAEWGEKHWRVDEYMAPLVDLYAGWGKADRLEEWKQRRAALDPKPAGAG
ncbi:MAG: serine/threonine-protein kinase [Rudaea sp.]